MEELNTALQNYKTKWQELVSGRKNKEFFARLRPTAIAWKTEDLADFDKRFAELRGHAKQVHLGWVNNRWLATFCLRDMRLAEGIVLVKLMQRRPGSADAVGLDHVDFYIDPQDKDAKDILAEEPGLKWTEEKNGAHCKWLSIWFQNTEAKLRSDSTWDVCIGEMQDVRSEIFWHTQ